MPDNEEEPTSVTMAATCHTEGCTEAGVTYVVRMYPNATEPIFRAQCGQCGQPITDLVTVVV